METKVDTKLVLKKETLLTLSSETPMNSAILQMTQLRVQHQSSSKIVYLHYAVAA